MLYTVQDKGSSSSAPILWLLLVYNYLRTADDLPTVNRICALQSSAFPVCDSKISFIMLITMSVFV